MIILKNKKPAISVTRKESLKCRPVKNPEIEEVSLDTGQVIIKYPVKVRPWIAGLSSKLGFESRPVYKKIELDEMGAAAWAMMDGKSRVKDIIRRFEKKYKLHPKEAEISVTQFIRDLGKRGLIGLRQ